MGELRLPVHRPGTAPASHPARRLQALRHGRQGGAAQPVAVGQVGCKGLERGVTLQLPHVGGEGRGIQGGHDGADAPAVGAGRGGQHSG